MVDSKEVRPSAALEVLYGLVNVVILAPVCVSFTAIIFSHPFFAPHLPSLTKLVMFSSALHQFCFSMFSTLPFAVGQVQDAGLIFLSAMAYTMVEDMRHAGVAGEHIITTVLVVLSVCTFSLGLALVLIGRLKFAILVQYIPVPVIGGYLAFIGFFCGKAGIVMMTGLETSGLTFISDMLAPDVIMLWLPGVTLGLGMYMALRVFKSPYVLPVYMFAMLGAFYAYLYYSGASLEDAREAYLIAPLTHSEPFYYSWDVFRLGDVHWGQLPRQFFRWLGMFIVVAFSSSLDVAAIEMELNKPLDYNKELQTVGVSNIISGLFGGYTGSYIFSQTIFSMRRKVSTRVCGLVICVSELVIITLPFSITSYLPRLFFGAFLTLICVDLMQEWLVAVRSKIMGVEFAVCWLAFASMQLAGVEAGLVLGILFSTIAFVFSYAKTTAVEPCFKSSTVVRTFKERALLVQNRGKLVTLSLQGHIFFGSAMRILDDVKSRVHLSSPAPNQYDGEESKQGAKEEEQSWVDWGLGLSSSACCRGGRDGGDDAGGSGSSVDRDRDTEMGALQPHDPLRFMYSPAPSPMKSRHTPLSRKYSFSGGGSGGKGSPDGGAGGYGALAQSDSLAETRSSSPPAADKEVNRDAETATEFLVLDFEKVFGIDATATRSCFLMLVQTMHKAEVVVVFTNMSSEIDQTLRANDVITANDIIIPLLDDALEWCEEQLITKYGPAHLVGSPTRSSQQARGQRHRKGKDQLDASYYANAFNRRRASSDSRFDLSQELLHKAVLGDGDQHKEHVQALRRILEDYLGESSDGEARKHSLSDHVLSKYFDRNVVDNEHVIFDVRQASGYVYFLEDGEIELVKISTYDQEGADSGSSEVVECIERVNKINSGGIFGESEFVLNSLHGTRALAVHGCVLWTLSRSAFRIMEVEHPQMCLLVQHILLKSVAISHHNSSQ